MVTCIFVVDGYEVDRQNMNHPGMDDVAHTWKQREKKGRYTKAPGSIVEVDKSGVFNFDHVDARGNHVFRGTVESEKV